MSKTLTNKDLKIELSFIPDNAQIYCRDLGYGFQLVFKSEKYMESRIFIRKEESNESRP